MTSDDARGDRAVRAGEVRQHAVVAGDRKTCTSTIGGVSNADKDAVDGCHACLTSCVTMESALYGARGLSCDEDMGLNRIQTDPR